MHFSKIFAKIYQKDSDFPERSIKKIENPCKRCIFAGKIYEKSLFGFLKKKDSKSQGKDFWKMGLNLFSSPKSPKNESFGEKRLVLADFSKKMQEKDTFSRIFFKDLFILGGKKWL